MYVEELCGSSISNPIRNYSTHLLLACHLPIPWIFTWRRYLVGGLNPTDLKNMSSSIGMMNCPTEWTNIIHVPNHQPDIQVIESNNPMQAFVNPYQSIAISIDPVSPSSKDPRTTMKQRRIQRPRVLAPCSGAAERVPITTRLGPIVS